MSSPTIFAISQMRHNLNFQKKYNDVNFYTLYNVLIEPAVTKLKILVRNFNFFVINPANLRYQTQVGGKQYYKLSRNLDCLRENLITQSIFSFFFFETTSGDLDKETGKVPTSLSPHTNHRDTRYTIY
jgi:hypothetical protein